ncbi:hypothetical protein BRARA_A01762 [Brassica rapa]|uniref:Membrane protein of ER body-like protein n=1 Tax=Brassica campestris TaxID=3711 RepID=A0A398AUR4_BRACM|nr:hypothetical protein BRARA_A01762 [Brassica rapa]
MESTAMNQTPSPSSTVDDDNGDGVNTEEFTKLPPDSPHSSEDEDSVDFTHEQDSSLVPIGFELHEAIDTGSASRSVRGKDSQTERDFLDSDVEIVIKNQHEYYFYCPCCGEDITKTVKLVKKSDIQLTKDGKTKNEAADTKNDTRSEDKKTKVPSWTWFPVYLQKLFLSVYGHIKDKDSGKIEVDSKSTNNDLGTNSEEPSIDVKTEKGRPSFPKWYLDVFAWLFLCIIIALSFLFTSPQQSSPFITPPHLELPSISPLTLPSLSILWLLPAFSVLSLVIMAIRSGYIPIHHKEKGDKEVGSKSTDTTSEEQIKKTKIEDGQAADSCQDSDKKTDNQKVHPVLVDPPPPQEQPSMQIANKETPPKTQAEPGVQPDTQPEIPKSVEPGKGGNKIEILKSIVYGGLTQSITSLCTVTSAAASGASTLNVLALGVANLSSGLLLIVHSLQELINEKPKTRTNTDDQKESDADVEEEEEEDRYVEALGRREKWWFHRLIAISSFVVFGLIPPLVYGFSFRRRVEKRQEYKTLAVYAVSLLCIVLLSVAKAYVSKRREYVKTLFRYTSMATTASGFSTFMGYFVNQWLEKSGFYDESTETPRV